MAKGPAKPKAEIQVSDNEAFTDGRLVYMLRTPVEAHGETVDRLELREPTSMDLIEVGDAVKFDPSAQIGADIVSFDMPRMVNLLSRLATVPPSTIQRLSLYDLNQLRWTVAPFFNPL